MIYVRLVKVQIVCLHVKASRAWFTHREFLYLNFSLDVCYEIILTFEFQVYKARDKKNVIGNKTNHTSSGVEIPKRNIPLSPIFLLNKLPRSINDKLLITECFEEGVDPISDSLLKPIKSTSRSNTKHKDTFILYKFWNSIKKCWTFKSTEPRKLHLLLSKVICCIQT